MMSNSINRRSFLKVSAIAGAGLAVPSVASLSNAAAQEGKNKIPVRKLGNTGLEIPILSMGVMRADNPSVVRAAYNAGITHFDTANGYMNGANEEMLGNFFKDKPRDSFIIATKEQVRSGQEFAEKFETSMKRLQMDYVDILYLHAVNQPSGLTNAEIIEVMQNIKASGRAKHLGVSIHGQAALLEAAVDAKVYEVVLTQYNLSGYNNPEMMAATEKATKAGVGLVAMKTMMGGSFMDRERTKPVNISAALKWVWSNPNICTAIPGMTSFDHLETNLAAALHADEWSDDEKQFIAMAPNEKSLFCHSCYECVGQCRKHLPIPDMMRAYMYNYGYGAPALAMQTVREFGVAPDACNGCSECTVTHCRAGFNIAAKVRDISRISAVPQEFLV